jgi:hypothetical protein
MPKEKDGTTTICKYISSSHRCISGPAHGVIPSRVAAQSPYV